MPHQPTGPACGNNPNYRMSDGDRQAVADFRAYLAHRAALRDRIAEVLWPLTDWDGDQLNAEAAADAVLAVLPPRADRGAVIAATVRACATHIRERYSDMWTADAADSLELNAARIERGEPTNLQRRMADETAPTEAQAAEDPARIDRLRPEVFEHASIESIDAQIRRAQRQQCRWGNRERTLAILRQARVTQKEHGEEPAAGAQQDGVVS